MLASLHVDLNSFFASVEQQHDPALRDRPIAVVPLMADSTFVLAASYQAKAHGVKTGVRVGDAKRLCPDLLLVQANTARYVAAHHQVLKAVDTVWPVHKVWSIDEVECRLTGPQRDPALAMDLAVRIKRAIAAQAGAVMKCSIGIAPSQLIAKLGTDMHKPDGLVMIQAHELPQRLYALKLTELAGIGPQMHKRLLTHGVATFEQLASLTEPQAVKAFGSVDGLRFHRAIRGLDYTQARTIKRTIGHEHVLGPALRTDAGARAVIIRLLTKAAWRARQDGYLASRLHVWARTESDQSWEAEAALEPPTNQLMFSLDTALRLWSQWPGARRAGNPRKVGVTFTGLEPVGSATGSLFEQAGVRPTSTLDKAVDAINGKFGRDTIYPASMQQARSSAPNRIAFSQIPTLEPGHEERPPRRPSESRLKPPP